jgi:alkaline phosphatase D
VAFFKAGAYANESPRSGKSQFFGHVDLGADDVFTASLRDATGTVLWSKSLQPQR